MPTIRLAMPADIPALEVPDRAIRFRKALVPGIVVGPGMRPPVSDAKEAT